ncbi:hypothetical protein AB0C87_16410 [Actinomadura sp. NPDC048021]|uniref:hypothetical protein n=1 Tax=Actinomadura sp. NPDC048021 TaxID=3155385 RepID=UPI0033F40DD0
MSLDRYRWDMKAQQLRFGKVETARRQAESWRTGLAGLTTLFGAVLVVKGRDGFTDLETWTRWGVIALLLLALAALVAATLRALSAAHGLPSDEILMTGEDLENWSDGEVVRVRRSMAWALGLTLLAVFMIAVAVVLTWTAPTSKQGGVLLTVDAAGARYCGKFISAADGKVILSRDKTMRIIPLATVKAMETVAKCPS